MSKFKNLDLTARRIAASILNDATRRGGAKRFPFTRPVKRKVALDLLRRAGIPFDESISPFDKTVHWDGKCLASKGESASSLIHEVAHAQCATPRRRKIPEYGLGVGPNGHSRAFSIYGPLSDPKAHPDEEIRASLLGILWERAMGSDFWATLEEHQWAFREEPDWDSGKERGYAWETNDTEVHIKWLLKRKLINGHGRPLLNFRTK